MKNSEPIFLIIFIIAFGFIVATAIKKLIENRVDQASTPTLTFEQKQLFISGQRERQKKLQREHDDFRRSYEQQMRDFKNR